MFYFTSDLHVSHEAVIRYCKRPFDNVQQMNEALVFNWNKKVRENDLVYVLGDLTLGRYNEVAPIISQLVGRKILIKGNHDGFSNGQYEKLGFENVFDEIRLRACGRILRLSHFPYSIPWYKRPFAYKSELRFMDRRPPRVAGEILLHGHTHTKYRATRDGRIHVGVDAWNYTPVSLTQIESLLARIK